MSKQYDPTKDVIVTVDNLKTFKDNLDFYEAGDNITFSKDTETNKIKISSTASGGSSLNYEFEVDEDGNLCIVYGDEQEAPTGFSIDEDGYLVYTQE